MKLFDKNEDVFQSLGFLSSILIAVTGAVALIIAILTPPISGPFCTGAPLLYPYTDILSRFPRDYIWMYPAMLMLFLYIILFASIYRTASGKKKSFAILALSFCLISSTILLTDYFVQVSVIQPSLLNGETDAIAILTQYNPHGIFIALEELGYLVMSVSFLFIAFAFPRKFFMDRIIRFIFFISFILVMILFLIISAIYGVHREYIFEVAAISIDWLTLIITGILLSFRFKTQ